MRVVKERNDQHDGIKNDDFYPLCVVNDSTSGTTI